MAFNTYSLSHLKDSLNYSMCSEATPEEVYLTIVNSIKQESMFHEACLNSADKLLTLINDDMIGEETEDSVTLQVVSTPRHGKDMDAL